MLPSLDEMIPKFRIGCSAGGSMMYGSLIGEEDDDSDDKTVRDDGGRKPAAILFQVSRSAITDIVNSIMIYTMKQQAPSGPS